MILAHVIASYITLNMLIIAGFACLAMYPILAGFLKRTLAAGALLKLHYAILSALFLVLVFHPLLPEKKIFNPAVQIWSAQSMDSFAEDYSPQADEGYLELPGIREVESFDTNNAKLAVSGFILSLLTMGCVGLLNDLRKLFLVRKGSYPIRRCGSVSIYANDGIKVPFSYWLPGTAYIIVPTNLIVKRPDYKITIFHELQHHRNGDTKWIYLLWFLRSICIFNPFIYLWCRLISELQEFACDEVLVDRKKIDSRDYANCLYDAAKSISGRGDAPLCATGLMSMVQRRLLKRRVERMLGNISNQLRWKANLGAALLIIGVLTSVSLAAKGVVQDRRITPVQAAAMGEKAGEDTDFPIAVNDLVVKELNAYLGTSEGREFIQISLKRMKNYRKGIEKKIKEYGVPKEFLAIPLVESGYQNLEQKKWGAGLWMFIQSTARAFGLTVNDKVDERLNVDILTDAAMRYLSANNLRFNDWQLAVLACNIGESNVQKTIEKIGSRNIWDVSRAFFKEGDNYYAKFMAAVIILKNPDFLAHRLDTISQVDEIRFADPMAGWISSRFGNRKSPFTNREEFHAGIDISARKGSPIRAAASGTVQKITFTIKPRYFNL